MMYITGTTKFLKTYAPNFCWCSAFDLLIMLEQVPELEDVTENTFKVSLTRLKKLGFFISRKNTHRRINSKSGCVGDLYLRVK